jgi:hypothetical protein
MSNHFFIRIPVINLALSVILLTAIYLSDHLVSAMVGTGPNMQMSTLSFSESGYEIRQLDPFNAYDSISRKPLFDLDREPEKLEVKNEVIQIKKDLLVQAIGIAVTGETILAVIKDLDNGKIYRLRIDEEINGWALKSVSADSFVFSKSEIEKSIGFKNSGN